jgi:hypothetical protein
MGALARIRRIGLWLVIILLAALIASQMITNDAAAAVRLPPDVEFPSDEPTLLPGQGHNNWAEDPPPPSG